MCSTRPRDLNLEMQIYGWPNGHRPQLICIRKNTSNIGVNYIWRPLAAAHVWISGYVDFLFFFFHFCEMPHFRPAETGSSTAHTKFRTDKNHRRYSTIGNRNFVEDIAALPHNKNQPDSAAFNESKRPLRGAALFVYAVSTYFDRHASSLSASGRRMCQSAFRNPHTEPLCGFIGHQSTRWIH